MRWISLLTLAVAACGGGAPQTRGTLENRSGHSLVGAWDARLSLLKPYQLEAGAPPATRICGTIGFVDNRHAVPGSGLTGTSLLAGVYDLDLSMLGLNWLGDIAFPTAVANAAEDVSASGAPAGDSVSIVLNPGSQERITLAGRYDPVGISGEWIAQSKRGTAAGLFSLTPHVTRRDQSTSC